ncbi:phospholipid-translocating ATPase [Coprinopsis sp. MPI-PUGE-AT-0042]|nr:phospholipid-translocating ATPase [Coprinopsis sp. MPI-PUGE-AT-0042]
MSSDGFVTLGIVGSTKFAGWYDRWAAWKVEDLFSKKREPGPRRTVYINEDLPEDLSRSQGRVKKDHIYATNQVITSKYTVLTFLPRNLLEQFRRIANITISPGLVILPLLIVLGITAAKDGYEDVKRHQSDRQVNHTLVRVMSGGDWVNPNVMEPKSKTFVRGVIPQGYERGGKKIKNVNPGGEELAGFDDDVEEHHSGFPRLHSHGYGEGQKAHWKKTPWEDLAVGDFVKIVDDESLPADILICATSEEENVCFVETKNLDGETNLKSRNAVSALTHIKSAADCASAHNSFRINCDRPDVNMYKMNAAVQVGQDTFPVDMQNVLLRGTVVRNTKWVIGVVIYTGGDTRIVMNSGGTPSKRSKVERQMNPQAVTDAWFSFLNLMLLACMAVVCAVADYVLQSRYQPLGAPWLWGGDRPGNNPSINGTITFFFALITSLGPAQAAFIYFDSEIYYPKTKQATVARSWNLSDDLGQIEYIFSDKTGTLTQNAMVFQKCSIGGKVYNGDASMMDERREADRDPSEDREMPDAAIPNDLVGLSAGKEMKPPGPPPDYNSTSGESASFAKRDNKVDGSDPNAVPNPSEGTPVKTRVRFHDVELTNDLRDAVSADANSHNAAHARNLNGFFSVLALTRPRVRTRKALVQAAADAGFVFRGREKEVLLLQTPFSGANPGIERYELLNILEFTSARKRMSVIVRKLDGDDRRLFLLCKGADNVIFERLKEGYGDDLKQATEKHLDEFAGRGLGVYMPSPSILTEFFTEEFYEAWSERYHEATVAMDDREEKVEAVSSEIEKDLRLLGATAIEDRLQDGIWVATGDKLETGHCTNLIGRDSNIIVIRGGNEVRPVWDQIKFAVEEFFPGSGILSDEGDVRDLEAAIPARSPGDRRRSGSFFGAQSPAPDQNLRRINTGLSSIVGDNNGDKPGGFVLVIDGTRAYSCSLAMLCEGVICCRVSPLQKALIVRLVKDGIGAMTLAIGDGANDVSMIQAADVGVGISGEEGLQAVNSSDYAIAQFRFLKRLLLVHGHWSYYRNGNMIINFFYKNIVCIGVLWWFQIYSGWSSNYVLEYTYLLFWNSFWTIAPVIALDNCTRFGREGRWFGMGCLRFYMLDGIMQYSQAVIFFLIRYSYDHMVSTRPDGYDVYLRVLDGMMFITMAFAAVFTANFFNGLNTQHLDGLGLSSLSSLVVYNSISTGWFVTPVWGNNVLTFRSGYFWLCLILAYRTGYYPDDIDVLRYARKVHPGVNLRQEAADEKEHEEHTLAALRRPASVASRNTGHASSVASIRSRPRPSMDHRSASRTDMATGITSQHRGFDFATEEGGVAIQRMQTNLSERYSQSRVNVSRVEESPKRRKLTLPRNLHILRRKGSNAKELSQ